MRARPATAADTTELRSLPESGQIIIKRGQYGKVLAAVDVLPGRLCFYFMYFSSRMLLLLLCFSALMSVSLSTSRPAFYLFRRTSSIRLTLNQYKLSKLDNDITNLSIVIIYKALVSPAHVYVNNTMSVFGFIQFKTEIHLTAFRLMKNSVVLDILKYFSNFISVHKSYPCCFR